MGWVAAKEENPPLKKVEPNAKRLKSDAIRSTFKVSAKQAAGSRRQEPNAKRVKSDVISNLGFAPLFLKVDKVEFNM